jgi:uncharacterized membrane protein YfcA
LTERNSSIATARAIGTTLLIGGVIAAPLGAVMAKRIPTTVMLVLVGAVLTITSTYGFIRAVL